MASRKRRADTSDLSSLQPYTNLSLRGCASTLSSSLGTQRTSKQVRTLSSIPGSSQATPIEIYDEGEPEDRSQEVDDEHGHYEEQYSYELYGVMSAKVVGWRHYNGIATMGENVISRREPHNQYDSNAIQVLNVLEEQIGHIPRGLASKLANYMDDRSLLRETTITGPKSYYGCPIEIRMYSTNDPVERENLLSRVRA